MLSVAIRWLEAGEEPQIHLRMLVELAQPRRQPVAGSVGVVLMINWIGFAVLVQTTNADGQLLQHYSARC